ncbi:MAG: S9 family peptidase [Rhodanobacteraceae bacterium]|nr:S9 family peptidase [Rhodanobacteraceae bacterium]
MKTRISATLALLATLTTAAADPIPIDTLARMPSLQSVSMSSDGKHLIALAGKPEAEEFDTVLATWDLEKLDQEPKSTASGDRMKFVNAIALKAGHLLVVGRQEWTGELAGCGEGRSTGSTKTFVTKIYLTDIEQTKFEEAFADKGRDIGISENTRRCLELAGSARLVEPLPLDPDRVIIAQLDTARFRDTYFRYNLRTRENELLYRATGRSSPGLFDPRTGDVLTRTQLEPIEGGEYEQQILILNADSGEFEIQPALTTKLADRYTVDIVGRDEESGKFYVLTDLKSDRVQAMLYDAKTKAFDPEPLLSHPQFSIGRVILGTRKSDFNKIIGFTVNAASPETTWLEPRLRAIQEGLKKSYPGMDIAILSYTDARDRVLFSTESNRHPPAYHLLLDGKQVKPLGAERTGINPDSIGEQRWVTYKARDGMKIPALLDLPPGWKKGDAPLPAVIHPHGGPWARDFGGWDASGWVPFLTSRGYAVLRPQYRGSSGLGRALWLAGDAEWGQKMQDDKDDGAAWLVEQGIADKQRLHIFGYSYGGFAASAAAVRPGSPYRCAIAGAPVTDLARLGVSWSENRVQRILQGRTVTGMDPMKHTGQANIPILLYVGDRDVRTPAFHARDYYRAVKNKVEAQFELIPDMPHSLPWYPRHHRKTLTLIEDFLSGTCAAAKAS